MAAKKSTKVDNTKTVSDLTEKLFELMGLKVSLNISEDKENEALRVNVDAGEEAGLIIGSHGKTLNSIQLLLGVMHRQKTGEWKRIVVDVGNWREKEDERLSQIAITTADRAKQTGKPQTLYNLSASQRRTVHMVLSEDKDIVTESFGEGKERYLVISPK